MPKERTAKLLTKHLQKLGIVESHDNLSQEDSGLAKMLEESFKEADAMLDAADNDEYLIEALISFFDKVRSDSLRALCTNFVRSFA